MYTWYALFNLTQWLATGLVQRTLVLNLEDLGEQKFLITQGNNTSVLWEDKFLPVNFLGQNPYVQDGVAIARDVNDMIFIGFEVES